MLDRRIAELPLFAAIDAKITVVAVIIDECGRLRDRLLHVGEHRFCCRRSFFDRIITGSVTKLPDDLVNDYKLNKIGLRCDLQFEFGAQTCSSYIQSSTRRADYESCACL